VWSFEPAVLEPAAPSTTVLISTPRAVEPVAKEAGILGAGRRGTTVCGVLRWLCALVVGAVVTWFSLLLITGHYSEEGPVLFSLLPNHGLHRGDLFVIAGWAVSLLALLVLAVMPSGPPRSSSAER
jgi:hypothetical protein